MRKKNQTWKFPSISNFYNPSKSKALCYSNILHRYIKIFSLIIIIDIDFIMYYLSNKEPERNRALLHWPPPTKCQQEPALSQVKGRGRELNPDFPIGWRGPTIDPTPFWNQELEPGIEPKHSNMEYEDFNK